MKIINGPNVSASNSRLIVLVVCSIILYSAYFLLSKNVDKIKYWPVSGVSMTGGTQSNVKIDESLPLASFEPKTGKSTSAELNDDIFLKPKVVEKVKVKPKVVVKPKIALPVVPTRIDYQSLLASQLQINSISRYSAIINRQFVKLNSEIDSVNLSDADSNDIPVILKKINLHKNTIAVSANRRLYVIEMH